MLSELNRLDSEEPKTRSSEKKSRIWKHLSRASSAAPARLKGVEATGTTISSNENEASSPLKIGSEMSMGDNLRVRSGSVKDSHI